MRKNKTMRAAALLLALVLITSCFVGGTMAKYVTSVTDTDNVRIAHWGFEKRGQVAPGWNFPAVAFDLFSAEYDKGAEDKTVVSGNGDNVIAPGTTQEAAINFIYSGSNITGVDAPEVDYNLTIKASITDHELLNPDNERLDWSLTQGGITRWYATHDQLLEAIAALTGTQATCELNPETGAWEITATGKFEAGTLPQFLTEDETMVIGWKWNFAKGEDVTKWDEDDTFFGNLAAKYGYSDKLVFTIGVTAEQVD